MADQNKPGMISGMTPLNILTGDELLEVSQLGQDGVWHTYSILVSKIRTNQGLSAYEVAVKNGYQGTEAEWLTSLQGKSAYQVAKELGFTGTEQDWLASLVGPSAYQSAQSEGFTGTEAEWLESLKGKSAFELAQAAGYKGTEADWLKSLVGKSAYDIAKEVDPTVGTESEWLASLQGKSAYQLAVDAGFTGTEAEWRASLKGDSAYKVWLTQPGNAGKTEAEYIASLKGADGKDGTNGTNGTNGKDGQSTYELWVTQPGNDGKTEEDFLQSLEGQSAFQLWVSQSGNEGKSEQDFLESLKGADGKSAYQIWAELPGNEGKSETEYFDSLQGTDGKDGEDGTDGTDGDSAYQLWEAKPGNQGKTEDEFLLSLKGPDGKSAYDIAQEAGFQGTETQWLASLKGVDGANGQSAFELWQSQSGNEGKTEAEFLSSLQGKSAYQTWLAQPGNAGKTEDQFITALKGARGEQGLSAYQIWVNAGNSGTEAQFLTSLKGKDGTNGTNGENGKDGKGVNVIATVSQSDFDQIVADGDAQADDAYFVDTFLYVFNGTDWVKSNSLQGPDGKGLNYLGTWPTGTALPTTSGYVAGDTYIWGATAGKISLWTLSETPTRQWVDIGVPGPQGKSAYQSWVDAGNTGSEADFVASLKGKSAYQTWVAQPGNEGKTEADFVASLKGQSTYQLWQSQSGNAGKTEAEFLESIKGSKGDTGAQGKSAYQVWTELPGNAGKTEAEYEASLVGPQGEQGAAAVAFTIQGQLSDESELPRPGEPTKAYYVGKNLYVWIDSKSDYENLGSLNGESAYQLWLVQPGNAGKTEQDFLNSLIGKSAYQTAVDQGFTGTSAEWLASLHGTDGKDGDSAYQLWVAQPGNDGKTESDFLESLKGRSLDIKGVQADEAAIKALADPEAQDAWVADDTGHLWIYSGTAWIDAGKFRGTDGKDGTDGEDGAQGDSAFQTWLAQPGNEGKTPADFIASLKGANGKDGTNGTNGRNVVIKGSVATFNDLASISNPAQQDAYTVRDTGRLYMYITSTWTDLGQFKGDKGDTGTQGVPGQGLVIVAEVATIADRPAASTLRPGDAVFVVADHKLYQVNDAGVYGPGISIQGPTGDQGQQGVPGPAGTSITIMGSYANKDALVAAHPTGNAGEGYLIGDDLWLYGVNPTGGATEWYDAGPVRGPQGIQGNDGPRGLRGLVGPNGERGSLWLTLPAGTDTPGATYGRSGDWAVNSSFMTFYKDENSGWIQIGRLVAGDVNSPSAALGKVVRQGTDWVKLPVDAVPNAQTGVQYAMKGNSDGSTTWTAITFPSSGVPDVPTNTNKPQGRTSAGWTEVIAMPTGLDATKRYIWMAGAFALSPIQAAAPSTVDTALCYKVDSNGVGSWVVPSFNRYSLLQDTTARQGAITPDFSTQQTFRINGGTGSSASTITLNAANTGRTMMAVFVVEGNVNKLAFASGAGSPAIGYNGNVAAADIEYGATQTVITAFWNGFGTWIIAKGPSY